MKNKDNLHKIYYRCIHMNFNHSVSSDSINLRFNRKLKIHEQPTYIRNMYLYILNELKQSRVGNYEDSQSMELKHTIKGCCSGSKSNFYKAIKFFVDNNCIIKDDDSNSIYYVNPKFINVMSKRQLIAFNNDLIDYMTRDFYSHQSSLE